MIAARAGGVLSRADYLALGVRQSIFPVDARERLYDLFDKYRAWLMEAGLFDLGLVAQASRALAGIAAAKPEAGLAVLSRRVLSRGLSAAETAVFERERQRALSHYRDHPDEAVTFTTVGQQLPPPGGEAPDLAAWMTVASLMLNLDEAMTRE